MDEPKEEKKAGAPIGNKNAEKWGVDFNNTSDFKNEKEYQTFIELNIELFCKDVLKLGAYVSHKTNKSIQKQGFTGTKERVDLFVVGKEKTAIIELKYPKNCFSEMRSAISQVLHYSCVADNCKIKYDKLCIVSPSYDERIFEVIKKYSLPIELYYLTKESHSRLEI